MCLCEFSGFLSEFKFVLFCSIFFIVFFNDVIFKLEIEMILWDCSLFVLYKFG